jgi:hypothetical protein
MHFHLPKPLHGWRAFVGEVGIIVVGVLIALGAEQVVETIHWRHQLDAERKALDDDVASTWDAMSARQIIQQCVDRRLDELGLVFARHEQSKALGIIGPIGRPGVWSASQGALQMATADGSLSHMPFKEKRKYFAVAADYDIFARTANEERDSWRTLQALDDPAALDAEDWRDLRKAYRDAIDSNRVMKSNLATGTEGNWVLAFKAFPALKPNKEALTLWMVRALCRPAVER